MVLPPTFEDPGEGWPPHLKFLRDLQPDDHDFVRPWGPTPEQARAALAATYGMIEFVDDGVGRILATLDRLDLTDDTIVIFTSDHGDMMGDHGLILKGVMHFQGCLRVPLTIHVPGNEPGRTDSLASSLDLAQTILDLCEVDAYQGVQGHSLRPVLEDPTTSVRETVLIEDDFPPVEGGQLMPLKARTVISDLGRYTRYSNRFEQLFDLAVDPDELVDLTEHDATPIGERRRSRSSPARSSVPTTSAAQSRCRSEPSTHPPLHQLESTHCHNKEAAQ